MTDYKALRDLSHRETGEFLPKGSLFSDDVPFDAEPHTLSDGRVFRAGWLSGRKQADKNLLLMGHVIEIVDKNHEDYSLLNTDESSIKIDNKDDE